MSDLRLAIAIFTLFFCLVDVTVCAVPDSPTSNHESGTIPKPGDLYREFSIHNGGDRDWRVTDKNAVIKFDRAKHHLPNSRLNLAIEDLQHAVRAEVLLDRWGGHRGTINKRIRFNKNEWIGIPEIQKTPDSIRPEMLMYQDNPVVSVPLDHLRQGNNLIDADCDEAGGFGWGQWGLYSLVLRVYYDAELKGKEFQISGQIASPVSGATISDRPVIKLNANASMGVSRIDVIASYNGYDEDGDGDFQDWHESHFQPALGQANEIRDHVGTLTRKPYALHWQTDWIPDQKPRGISLIARIQDSRGYWFVTQPAINLTLERDDFTVKLYPAINVPEDFAVRVGETKSCQFQIPANDPLTPSTQARLHLRTWHGWDGHHEPLKINDHAMKIDGKYHFYDYDSIPFPASALRHGKNSFSIHSKTEHHMLEVLWPGPAIVTRTPLEKPAQESTNPRIEISEDVYENRPHFVIKTSAATYWLDRNSGGLSRMIDPDGKDWIAFKVKPWDEYPASAASSFRGLPNLVFNGPDKGFGHPGWDQAESVLVDTDSIVCTSKSKKWRIRWNFSDNHVDLLIERTDPEHRYWLLYEGPIAGRWCPNQQYFATNTLKPTDKPLDFYNEVRRFENWKWAYFGDKSLPRILTIKHQRDDELTDTYSHLGDSENGLQSNDGMVVFGFGRGKGTRPMLHGENSFRIKFMETAGFETQDYERAKKTLD